MCIIIQWAYGVVTILVYGIMYYIMCIIIQWAYGVTCWEVFSCGKIPYGGVAPSSVLRLLKSDQRMEKPENAACTDEMLAILKYK